MVVRHFEALASFVLAIGVTITGVSLALVPFVNIFLVLKALALCMGILLTLFGFSLIYIVSAFYLDRQ